MPRQGGNVAKVAYFDCFSGCSGDMVLGALIDAGLSLETLEEGLTSLAVQGYKLSAEKVKRSTITATKFTVTMNETEIQPERSLKDVLVLIEASRLPQKVKNTASAVFQRLGEAESRIHDVPLEKVRFHEVGAVDSIIDIVGAAFGLDALKIERFYSSPLPSGKWQYFHGTRHLACAGACYATTYSDVQCSNRRFPEAISTSGRTGDAYRSGDYYHAGKFGRPGMTVEEVGYGAGTKDFEVWPNVMRIWIGEENRTCRQ
jgi:pyridinium-3,5-bisthiocarboxylic acid mononucleotide nickel chelatase